MSKLNPGDLIRICYSWGDSDIFFVIRIREACTSKERKHYFVNVFHKGLLLEEIIVYEETFDLITKCDEML